MRPRRVWCTLLLLGTPVAGCTDGARPPAPEPVPVPGPPVLLEAVSPQELALTALTENVVELVVRVVRSR